jgi:YidC/Oxa1 family membrane protein insertase
VDKKTLPLIFLLVLGAIFFGPIMDFLWPVPKAPPRPAGTPVPTGTNLTAQVTAPGIAGTNAQTTAIQPEGTQTATAVASGQLLAMTREPGNGASVETLSLENETMRVDVTSQGGGIQQVHLKSFDGIAINTNSPLGILSTAIGPEPSFARPYQLSQPSPDRILATLETTDGLQLTKEYRLTGGNRIDARLILKNTAASGTATNVHMLLGLGMATPLTYDDVGTYIGFTLKQGGETHNEYVGGLTKYVTKQGKPYERRGPIEWAGIRNQYFTVVSTPETPFASFIAEPANFTFTDADRKREIPGILAATGTAPIDLAAGSSSQWNISLYAGPKEYEALHDLGKGQVQMIGYDIGFFKLFGNALLWLMTKFHAVLGNWGFAIIAVTILIKVIFWPLTAISTRSMKAMQALAPKMNEVKEKYKDNTQKMNEEMMKLYRDYGVNPLAGCLPMLIQIPIFIAFYNMLMVSVELRGAPFMLWIDDLSRPDTVARLPIPMLGAFPINPLPLIMVATQIWQMKITPQSANTDPAMKMMMWFMPGMILFICYNFSSGLSLYWTCQNLLTILQTYYTKDKPTPELKKRHKAKGGGFTFNRPTGK